MIWGLSLRRSNADPVCPKISFARRESNPCRQGVYLSFFRELALRCLSTGVFPT